MALPPSTPHSPGAMLSLLSFCEFPWQNGLVLQGSRIKEVVDTWLALEPIQHPDISRALLEGQARHLGSVDLAKMFKTDPRKLGVLCKILNTPRAEFLQPSLTPPSQQNYVHDDATAAHILLQFHFFDQLMDAVGFPSNPSRLTYPKRPLELSIPTNLTKLLTSLKDWSKPINVVQALINSQPTKSLVTSMSTLSVAPQDEITLAPNASANAVSLRMQLMGLSRAILHSSQADLHKVFANFESAGFTATCLSREALKDLKNFTELQHVLTIEGVIVSHSYVARLGKDMGASMFTDMKLTYQVAASISPILLLLPKKLSAKKLNRHSLLSIAHVLGNIRPSSLQQVERAIWQAVLRIASGSPAEVEVRRFYLEYGAMVASWSQDTSNPPNFSFFDLDSIITSSTNAMRSLPTSSSMQIASAPHAQAESSAIAPTSPTIQEAPQIQDPSQDPSLDVVLSSMERLQTGIVPQLEEVIAPPHDSVCFPPAPVKQQALTIIDPQDAAQALQDMGDITMVVEEVEPVVAVPAGSSAHNASSLAIEEGTKVPQEHTVHSEDPEHLELVPVPPPNVQPQDQQEDQVMLDPGDPQHPTENLLSQSCLDNHSSLDTPSIAANCPATPPQHNSIITPLYTPTTRHTAANSEDSQSFMSSIFHMDEFLASVEATLEQTHPQSPHHSQEMTVEQIALMWAGRNRMNVPVESVDVNMQFGDQGLHTSPTNLQNLMELDEDEAIHDQGQNIFQDALQLSGPQADPAQAPNTGSPRMMDTQQDHAQNVPTSPLSHQPTRPNRSPRIETTPPPRRPPVEKSPSVSPSPHPGRHARGRKHDHQGHKQSAHVPTPSPPRRTAGKHARVPTPSPPRRQGIHNPQPLSSFQILRRSMRQTTGDPPPTLKNKKKEVVQVPPKPAAPPKTLPSKRSSTKGKTVLEGSLLPEIDKITDILSSEATPMGEEPLTIDIFSMEPGSTAQPFDFRTHKNVADDEYEILTRVQSLVESDYVQGIPRHHLPSARNVTLEPGASTFFIVEYKDFVEMSTQTIQDIARDRNIIVRHVPQPKYDWSLRTLSEVGALDQPRDIQVGECRDNDDVDGMLKVGTLRDLFNGSLERVLSCLQLPTSSLDVVETPGLRQLASDRWAWLQTRGSSGLRHIPHPIDVMNWATVVTSMATSWLHQDTEGFATSTQLLTGLKYWVIFTPDPNVAPVSHRGNLGCIAFSPPYPDFQNHMLEGWMHAEAILLGPGDLLLQRPNTLHYVLTLKHAVAIGHHYLPTSSIQDSIYQKMHSLARRGRITNAVHYDTGVLIRRMLTSWVEWYLYGNWDAGQERPAHVMDVSTIDGLFDLITVGCFVELSQALDERNYIKEAIPDDEIEEIEAATTRYRRFIAWFAHRFYLVIDNERVNPQYIFKRRLVDFAATMVLYVKQQMEDTHLADVPEHSLNDKRILTYIQMHLSTGYPDLLPAFMAAITSASRRLYYSGPMIELRRKDNDYHLHVKSLQYSESHDFSGAPLAPNQLQSALTRAFNHSDSSGDDDGDGEEEEEGSSPLSSPSPSDSSMRPPAPTATPPSRKHGHPSPASTPSKTSSSNRPKKRVK